jgi:NAD(P)-dependent dehydrogenase (short-subunit alcohol dehydrogenase family)
MPKVWLVTGSGSGLGRHIADARCPLVRHLVGGA